jgi:hypothetical protein
MPLFRTAVLVFVGSAFATAAITQEPARRWLAGDPHVHSRWSLDYDESKNPPVPIYTDAIYPIMRNAEMADAFGLAWMVTTDHGGPNHATLNRDNAYPELLESRKRVPNVLQFYGLELNMPGMDHHTVIVPASADEAGTVFEIESRFDAYERWPRDPARGTEAARVAALTYMQMLPRRPLVFANHPARSAAGLGRWGLNEPKELLQNIDLAPDVYRGMEGAPGHQANALQRDGQATLRDARGSYGRRSAQTLGGFDQMTAVVGGVWDVLLGEGRRFWITAGSDSHVHYTEASPQEGDDFWPGEFQKTYVFASPTYGDIFDGLRGGRMFVAAGDLVTELDVIASASERHTSMGGTLQVEPQTSVQIAIRFRDPEAKDARGDNPRVARVDLIVGDVRGRAGVHHERNESTRVAARFAPENWSTGEDVHQIKTAMTASRSMYIRVRGTSSDEPEPSMDRIGEGPWSDLWFYSNPIFIDVR